MKQAIDTRPDNMLASDRPLDGRHWDVALMQLVLADAQERLDRVVADLSSVPGQVQSRSDAERIERLAAEVREIARRIPAAASAVSRLPAG